MEGAMKLLLRRSQKPGVLGKVKFTLTVRAELTDDEKTAIRAYRFGRVLLYERRPFGRRILSWLNVLAYIRHWLMNLTITVSDLECGKRIECKDILHMLSVEAEIKEAAATFKAILESARHFGGEEVIELK
jgi:hypothetical protein